MIANLFANRYIELHNYAYIFLVKCSRQRFTLAKMKAYTGISPIAKALLSADKPRWKCSDISARCVRYS